MTVPRPVLTVREDACRECPTPCPARREGTLPIADAAALCPVGRWSCWGDCVKAALGADPKMILALGPRPVRLSQPPTALFDGSTLWAELHRRALAWPGGHDHVWLNRFSNRLPGGCPCRAHWRQLLAVLPPRWGDYFAWTVEAHNAVNRRLGKAEVTVEAARARWAG